MSGQVTVWQAEQLTGRYLGKVLYPEELGQTFPTGKLLGQHVSSIKRPEPQYSNSNVPDSFSPTPGSEYPGAKMLS